MEQITKLKEMIQRSKNIVFFGGAGVSTESGIPDFRSKDGLYNQKDVQFEKYSAEYLLSKNCLYQKPEVFYEFYKQKMDTRNILPNSAHLKLAKLEEIGKLKAIVTQNIDGLHQRAGSKIVHEIHGTTSRNYCIRCKAKYDSNFIFDSHGKIPTCPRCEGLVRPDVTLYGESLPESAWNNSMSAIEKADMLIIGGTSLAVYPACMLVDGFSGDNLVVINKESINKENWADLVIHDSICKVLDSVIE